MRLRWIVVIPLLTASLVTAESHCPDRGPELLRARNLHEFLRAWGPASGIALEGFDSESGLEPDGAVLVWYDDYPYALEANHSSRVTFFLQSGPLTVIAVSVQPEEAIDLQEVLAVYGPGYRRVRHRLIDVADGLEAELSDCHDPEGSQESLVYERIGLQTLLRRPGSDRVEVLLFSREILDGRKTFPPCQD